MLINKTQARTFAKKNGMRISEKSFSELHQRIEQVLNEACKRSRIDKRKTILPRDIHHEPDLFDL
mgnify:CR=1 FL=1